MPGFFIIFALLFLLITSHMLSRVVERSVLEFSRQLSPMCFLTEQDDKLKTQLHTKQNACGAALQTSCSFQWKHQNNILANPLLQIHVFTHRMHICLLACRCSMHHNLIEGVTVHCLLTNNSYSLTT
jgi:hypothetical protein